MNPIRIVAGAGLVGVLALAAVSAPGARAVSSDPAHSRAAAPQPVFFDLPHINGVTIHACRIGKTDRPRPIVLEWTNYILDDPHSYPAAGCPPQMKDLAAALVKRGYIYVAAQTRGVGASTGTADTWSVQDGKDGAAVVERLARERWSTGHIGLVGCSSSAQEGMQVVVAHPKHLNAAAIACVAPDTYRDAFYLGGLRSYSVLPVASRPLVDLDPEALQYALQHGQGPALLTEAATRLGADATFESHLLTDDTDTKFWASHGTESRLKRRTAPMLVYGSWADFFLRGTTEWARTMRPKDRLIFVPGWHGSPVTIRGRYGLTRRGTAFFDHFLRGTKDRYAADKQVVWWEQPGGVSLASTTASRARYRQSAAWPPGGTAYRKIRLGKPDSGTTLTRPSGSPAATTDVRGLGQPSRYSLDAESQGAVVTWTLPKLRRTMHLAGPVVANIRVTPATPELDLYVRLIAIAPSGSFKDVTNGWLRGAQRALDRNKSLRDKRSGLVIRPWHDHAATRLLTPDRPVMFNVELWQTGVSLPKGDRLRVVVTAEDTPWTAPSAESESGTAAAGGSSLVLPLHR